MKRFPIALAGVWIGLMAAPAASAQGIECMDSGYSADETRDVDRFVEDFRPRFDRPLQLPQTWMPVMTRRAGECADAHDWSPAAIEEAVFYRLASILKRALEERSPLTASQMARLTTAIASADQERLHRVFGAMLEATFEGRQPPEPSQADKIYFGRLLMRTGVPLNQEIAVYVGAYMGAIVMVRRSRDRFAAA